MPNGSEKIMNFPIGSEVHKPTRQMAFVPAGSQCRLALATALLSLTLATPRAQATTLFTPTGAGTSAIVTGTNVTGLSANNDSISFTNAVTGSDFALGFSSGLALSATGPATYQGNVYFSDPVTKTTSGTCSGNAGGICLVNTVSSISNTTITGATSNSAATVTAAVNQWLALTNTTNGWGSIAGTNVDLTNGGKLCAVAGSGCLATASGTATLTIQGVTQTAYVFNVTSNHIGGAVTIQGDGSGNTIVVLNYTGSSTLQSNQAITLAGALTDDQVLLNVNSAGGFQSAGGFTFNGAISITSSGNTADLDAAHINGRLFLNDTGSASIQSNFALTAPGDSVASTPEPTGGLLLGSGLAAIAFAVRRRKR